MSTPTPRLTRELVRTACLAPSVNNSQPWYFRLPADDCVELYADRARQLTGIDPSGRDLVLSCGAALHHLVAGAGAFGLRTTVETSPRADDPDLLAVVRLSEGEVTDAGVDLLAALENRKTDRRGAGSWPVPPARVHQLADDASAWGAEVVVLTDSAAAARTEELIEVSPSEPARRPGGGGRAAGAGSTEARPTGSPARIADPSDHLAGAPPSEPLRAPRHGPRPARAARRRPGGGLHRRRRRPGLAARRPDHECALARRDPGRAGDDPGVTGRRGGRPRDACCRTTCSRGCCVRRSCSGSAGRPRCRATRHRRHTPRRALDDVIRS